MCATIPGSYPVVLKFFCYISLYVCMYTCVHVTASIWKSQDKESALTFHHVDPGEQNEVIDLAASTMRSSMI